MLKEGLELVEFNFLIEESTEEYQILMKLSHVIGSREEEES